MRSRGPIQMIALYLLKYFFLYHLPLYRSLTMAFVFALT